MAGTVVLTSQRNEGPVRWARFTCTADAADGSFPATTLRSLAVFPDGTLLAIATNPGATAPTAGYDITLPDADGVDRLNGVGLNRDTSTSERVAITGAPYLTADEAGDLTLTIANNAVNSAVVVITLWYTTAAAGGASSGDATLAEQQTQTAHLAAIADLVLAGATYFKYGARIVADGSTEVKACPSGDYIVVTNVRVRSITSTDASVVLYFDTDNDQGAFDNGTDEIVEDVQLPSSADSMPGSNSGPIYQVGQVDDDLRVDVTGDVTLIVEGWTVSP